MATWLARIARRLGGNTRGQRGRKPRPWRAPLGVPVAELLESRLAPTVSIGSINSSLGTVTFTGNAGGDKLYLTEAKNGSGQTVLAYNLTGSQSSVIKSTLVIGSGSAPLVTVTFTGSGNTLTLGNKWSFNEPLTYTGGTSAGNTLAGPDSLSPNTWHLTGYAAGNINATSQVQFTEANTLKAGASDQDTLLGEDTSGSGNTSTWTVDMTGGPLAETYNDGTGNVTVANFGTLHANDGPNTFVLKGDSIDESPWVRLTGGNGSNTFQVQGSLDLSEASIDGGPCGDTGATATLDFSQATNPVNVLLQQEGAHGYDGIDNEFGGVTFHRIDQLIGTGSGFDQLTGLDDSSSAWIVDGLSTYVTTNSTLAFSGFTFLQGGSQGNTFAVVGPTSDVITGGAGNDFLDLSGAGAVTVALAGSDTDNSPGWGFNGTATGTGGFANIDTIQGNSSSTLQGEDAASTWALDTTQTYTDASANVLTFANFGTLQGGSAADTFQVKANTTANLNGGAGANSYVFWDAKALTGAIAGGAGADTLDLSAYTSAVSVSLTGSGASGFGGTAAGVVSGGFTGIDTVDAGTTGGGTLTGENAVSTWALDTTQTYTDANANVLTFSAFGTLQGGSAADTFQVKANTAANLNGGTGANAYVFWDGKALTGSITGGAGADTLDLSAYTSAVSVSLTGSGASGFGGTAAGVVSGGFTGIDTVDAGTTGGGTLTGENAVSTWALDTTQTYTDASANVLTFANFGTLQGGSAADTFQVKANTTANINGGAGANSYAFWDGKALTGSITGGAGADTLDLSAYTSAVGVSLTGSGASGFSGTAAGVVSGGFSGIDTIDAGTTGGGTLTGENAASTWTLNAAQTYTDANGNTLTFANFGTLQGGSAADTFQVKANTTANLNGGAGANSYVFWDAKALTGSITGGAGADTLDFTRYTSAVSVALTGSGASGFSGTSSVVSGGFSGIDTIDAGTTGGGTLTGENAASTWALDTTQTYTDANANVLTFANFSTLQGGSATDTFDVKVNTTANINGGGGANAYVFWDGKALTGAIAGGAGADTLDLSAYTSAVSVALTGSGGSGFSGTAAGVVSGGFTGIDTIDAGTTGGGTLTGENAVSTWALDTTQTYTDANGNTLTFSAFGSLQGGSAADTFQVKANTTANLNGGAGANSYVFWDGKALTGSITGGAGADTLDLSAYTSAVSVALTGSGASGFGGTAAGVVTGGFTAIDTIDAGATGGGTLTGENAVSTWALDTTQTYTDANGNTLTFANFGTLQGGSAADTFQVKVNTTANLNGGAGANAYVFWDGKALTGSITGGAGADTLDLSAYTSAVSVALTGSGASGFGGTAAGVVSGGYTGIDTIDAGTTGGGTLTGENVASTWTLDTTQTYTDANANVLTFANFSTLQGGSAADTFQVKANTTANLNGGAGANSYVFWDAKALTGSITGGAGADTLDFTRYTSAVSVALTGSTSSGFTGTSSVVSGGFSGIDTIDAGTTGGGGTLTGENAASTWALDTTQTYTDANANVLTFANFSTLQGGSAADTFDVKVNTTANLNSGGGTNAYVFWDGTVLTGAIAGGAGADTLDLSAYTSAVSVVLTGSTSSGFSGTAAGVVSGGFTGIDTIDAGTTGGGTLTGENAASTWALNTAQTYTDANANVLTFANFGTLQGGSAADTFQVKVNTTANLNGGTGANAYAFWDGKALTGSITGGAGADTLDLSAYTSSVGVALTGSGAPGFSGTAAGVVSGGFTGIDTIDAGTTGGGTLTGENAASTWALNAAQTYTDASANVLTFANFGTLQGGSAADTFQVKANTTANINGGAGANSYAFWDGKALTGSITGGAGADTLDLSAYTSAVGVALTGSGAPGFSGTAAGVVSGGFSGIDTIDAGTTGGGTLTGENAASTWALNAAQTYTDASANVLTFANFGTLQGGSAADTFQVKANTTANLNGGAGANSYAFWDGKALTGSITGGAGADTLDFTRYTSAVSVALTGSTSSGFTGTSSVVSGGFSGIDTIDAGTTGGGGTLTGENAASTWALDTTQTYTDANANVLTFANFSTLQGGSAADTFDVKVNTTANLNSGGGTNAYVFWDGTVLTGAIAGGAGADTLDLSAYTSAVSVVLTGSTSSGFSGTAAGVVSGGFTGIDTIDAGTTGGGTLTGENVASTWALNAAQTYTDANANVLTFANFGTLQGGSAADTFQVKTNTTANLNSGGGTNAYVFWDGKALTGAITGGAGADTLDFTRYTSAVSVTLTGSDTGHSPSYGFSGTAAGVVSGGFSGIDTVDAGTTGGGTLTGENVASTWALNAAQTYTDASANVLTFANFSTLQGGTQADTFQIKANTTANINSGGGTNAYVFWDGKALTGAITGGAGADTLDFTRYTSAVGVALTGSTSSGFSGTAAGVITGGFSGIDTIDAGTTGGGTLTGEGAASTWTLDTIQTYKDANANVLTFANFSTLQGGDSGNTFKVKANTTANLVGGAGNDVFQLVTNNVVLTGSIDGGSGGSDSLSYSGYSAAMEVDLYANFATGITGGFANVETFTGGSGANTLDGPYGPTTWDVTAGNAGTLTGGYSFSNFANLTGSPGGNTFVFSDGVGVTGTVTGGAVSDTLDFSAYSSGVTFKIGTNASGGSTPNNAGSVSSGGVAFNFLTVGNLTGGSGNDTFKMAGGKTVSGGLNGGGGVNTLDYSAYTTSVRATLYNGIATGVAGTVSNIKNVTGGHGNDILIGDGTGNTLIGGGGNDVLVGRGGAADLVVSQNANGSWGNNILIGGNGSGASGHATLQGGNGQDLMIAGTTSYDTNIVALNALMAEWGNTSVAFATRIAHLGGAAGGRNGTYKLTTSGVGATVQTSNGHTTMNGGTGGTPSALDWFFANVADTINDSNGKKQVTLL